MSAVQSVGFGAVEDSVGAPRDASECAQRFIALQYRLKENWCVYGRCSTVETTVFSPGEMRGEWFEASGKLGKRRLLYRHSVRAYEGVNLFSPNTIDCVLHVDGKRRYTTASPNRPLSFFDVSNEQLDAMRVKNRNLDAIFKFGKYPAPGVFGAIYRQGSLCLQQQQSEGTVDRFFQLASKCSFSDKLENGDVVGVWIPRKPSSEDFAIRVVFGKEFGHSPKLVQAFYLKETLELGEDIDVEHAKPWYEVRTKWKEQKTAGGARKQEFVPVEIVNTTYRVSRHAKEGNELQILAVWEPFKFDDVKISFDDARSTVAENGFEELHKQLAQRYANVHGE